MYRYLRNTHLFLGLFCCLFLLMYGISSVQMAHGDWFSRKPKITEMQFTLTPNVTDARAVARELTDQHGLRGELANVRPASGRLDFRIVRPGTVYEVEYTAEKGETKIRDNHAGFIGMLNRIHHVAGTWHDYWLVNAWGWFVGLVSACLFVIGGTGIYLWFKLHKERVIGTILLVICLGYSLTLLVLVRTSW